MSSRIDLPQGTLDLLILRTLSLEPQHGWGIAERVQQMSSEVLRIQQGSLYPALHRLERRGWIKARWGTSDNNRRARYYELTKAGRKQLDAETDLWKQLTGQTGAFQNAPSDFHSHLCQKIPFRAMAVPKTKIACRLVPKWRSDGRNTLSRLKNMTVGGITRQK